MAARRPLHDLQPQLAHLAADIGKLAGGIGAQVNVIGPQASNLGLDLGDIGFELGDTGVLPASRAGPPLSAISRVQRVGVVQGAVAAAEAGS